jgi:hypothetical protein
MFRNSFQRQDSLQNSRLGASFGPQRLVILPYEQFIHDLHRAMAAIDVLTTRVSILKNSSTHASFFDTLLEFGLTR